LKTIILENDLIDAIIEDLVNKIIKNIADFSNLIIIGIKEGGAPFADLIKKRIKILAGFNCQIGYVDMTLYRDDPFKARKAIKSSELPNDINDKSIILVDDVISSGRTVRAAIDDIMDYGRPRSIKLAVLIDRGGRELPICPDWTGKKIKVKTDEKIKVNLNGKNKTVEKILVK
jgi:pyrimidine operon attenuation protein/uracil phosphoribosyltransferase